MQRSYLAQYTPGSSKHIDLSRKNLEDDQVPYEELVKLYKNVERLDLFVNRISNLSPLIGQLVLLQKLDLYP
jgi:hypothetical protein